MTPVYPGVPLGESLDEYRTFGMFCAHLRIASFVSRP